MIKDEAVKFLKKECPYERVKELEESEEGYDPKMWKKMAELGWMALMFPEAYGGDGGKFMDTALILEAMGTMVVPSPSNLGFAASAATILGVFRSRRRARPPRTELSTSEISQAAGTSCRPDPPKNRDCGPGGRLGAGAGARSPEVMPLRVAALTQRAGTPAGAWEAQPRRRSFVTGTALPCDARLGFAKESRRLIERTMPPEIGSRASAGS